MELLQITNDSNGSPRYVVHFLNLLNDSECFNWDITINDKYNIALNKAKVLHGKRYNNKSFGGGIVFAAYLDKKQLMQKIESLK